jgi:hypothetical protein
MQTTLHTQGNGLWTTHAQAVPIKHMSLPYITDLQDSGELCVHFDRNDWDVDQLGLIYTDPLFLTELRAYLNTQGLAGDDVGYSEQGMQGDTYVSLDVGAEFIQSWLDKGVEL